MRKFVPIVAAAAFAVLASDAPVAADQVVTDTVDIMDVDEDNDVVGLPDGVPPPRWYIRTIIATLHAKGIIQLPPDPVLPPDPCIPLMFVWNIIADSPIPPTPKFKIFTTLLRKMEQKGCRVEIDRPADDAPEVEAIEIRPTLD